MDQQREQVTADYLIDCGSAGNVDDLRLMIGQLENDKRRMKGEFDSQRAKLKELFLQKEGELERKNDENAKLVTKIDELRCQLNEVKNQVPLSESLQTQDEIRQLQQLIQDTVEENTSCKTIYDMEVKRLHGVIQQYEAQVQELRNGKQHQIVQEQTSMAPSVMLSAVTKTLVRKLGATESVTSQDSLEDSMRKVDDDDHAQEDVEVLRSLVVPLEEEIKALKDKLRATDEQLQKCQQCKHYEPETTAQSGTGQIVACGSLKPCDMCSNYEAQLVKEQKKSELLHCKVLAAEKASERHREELLKEIGFRKEIEERWNEKKEQHKQQVFELTTKTNCAEQDLKEMHDLFRQARTEINQNLMSLTQKREAVHQELDRLQKENEYLIGKYSVHSQQLQSEIINLPDKVEELQELILKMHQDLIIAKISKESAEDKLNSLQCEFVVIKDQLVGEQSAKEYLETSLAQESSNLRSKAQQFEMEKQARLLVTDSLANLEKFNGETLAEIDELKKTRKHLEDQNGELRSRVSSLQQELDTSEAVQKDFVKLSQSLQVELQKIRDADTQVRWQHDEDVEECPGCRTSFNASKRASLKHHCKHCGQVFCLNCLSHSVASGPNNRLSKVCDVCHTLLVKSSAPYFSTEVPHSPD